MATELILTGLFESKLRQKVDASRFALLAYRA